MDYILYELSLEKLDRQVTEFGKIRMQREVRKLQRFAASCQKSRSCFKSKFTTIRDSPNASDRLKLSKLKGNKIGTRLDMDYGKFYHVTNFTITWYQPYQLSPAFYGLESLLIQSLWECHYLNVTNYIFLVAKQMSENGGGCERGLFTSISHDRKPWPICSHSNHMSWWSKDELNEQNNII